jgi:hypothetical protein
MTASRPTSAVTPAKHIVTIALIIRFTSTLNWMLTVNEAAMIHAEKAPKSLRYAPIRELVKYLGAANFSIRVEKMKGRGEAA